MPRVALTFGDTVKSFPALANSKSRKVQKAIRRILEKTANEVIRALKRPGRDYNDQTGKLRRSWRKSRLAGYRYQISNLTTYASYIEYGTIHIAPRRMLHRELNNARARLRRRLRKLNRKVLKGAI